jgi:peptidoglycan hydrolase CwlO-like protein
MAASLNTTFVSGAASSSSAMDNVENIDEQLKELNDSKKQARDAVKKAAKECKNMNKKKQRLVKKAKQLSTNDLLAVYKIRESIAKKKNGGSA